MPSKILIWQKSQWSAGSDQTAFVCLVEHTFAISFDNIFLSTIGTRKIIALMKMRLLENQLVDYFNRIQWGVSSSNCLHSKIPLRESFPSRRASFDRRRNISNKMISFMKLLSTRINSNQMRVYCKMCEWSPLVNVQITRMHFQRHWKYGIFSQLLRLWKKNRNKNASIWLSFVQSEWNKQIKWGYSLKSHAALNNELYGEDFHYCCIINYCISILNEIYERSIKFRI